MADTATAPKWEPKQYGRFASERARPFDDLLAHVELPGAAEIVDLGCGPGNLTARLAERWPAARVLGIDSSPEMLADAETLSVPGRLEFRLGDLRSWEPASPVDLLVSNATLQWVPSHLDLLEQFADALAPGGILAFQVPGNFGEPTHRLLDDLTTSKRWAPLLQGRMVEPPSSHDPGVYLDSLSRLGLVATAWETTYLQVLSGDDAVLNWMKGTALRPVLTVLREDERAAFLNEYGSLLDEAYRPGDLGTVLPYRRVFAVGERPGESPNAATVAGLDHAQVAMPAGRETEGRSFYCGVLGFVEVAKPPVLAARGGCWFKAHGAEVHLGVDKDFRPAEKAHVGLTVTDLDVMAARVAAAGHRVTFDEELAPRRRFFTDDPFGNRVEIMGHI